MKNIFQSFYNYPHKDSKNEYFVGKTSTIKVFVRPVKVANDTVIMKPAVQSWKVTPTTVWHFLPRTLHTWRPEQN